MYHVCLSLYDIGNISICDLRFFPLHHILGAFECFAVQIKQIVCSSMTADII